MRHTTLKDVARTAGVSPATASRALNNRNDVDQMTRQKVLETAKDLCYTPNPLARGLLSGATKTIGVLVTSIQNPFFAAVVAGIEKALAIEGYTMILCNSHEDAAAEQAAIDVLIRRRVDGLIVAPLHCQPDGLELLFESNVPFVFVARYMPAADTDYVVGDDEAVGRLAAEHLIAKGHRRIVFLNSYRNSSAMLRQRGFEEGLRAHGLSADAAMIRVVANCDQIEEVTMAAVRAEPRPSALFSFCDDMTVAVLQVLASHGMNVPSDIAVISCDNLSFTGLLQPSLTTVEIPESEMGVEAVKILLAKIKRRKKKTTQVILTPRLIERSST